MSTPPVPPPPPFTPFAPVTFLGFRSLMVIFFVFLLSFFFMARSFRDFVSVLGNAYAGRTFLATRHPHGAAVPEMPDRDAGIASSRLGPVSGSDGLRVRVVVWVNT